MHVVQGPRSRPSGPALLGNRYRLVDRLGVGGMAMVWRARDEVLGREVAVKVLAGENAFDRVSRERIRAEAKAAAKLSHPHVTSVYDYGESRAADGSRVPYVVMELLTGGTLAERLTRGALPWRSALRIGAEVAAGLAAAHSRGLVHRDVKPANIVLTAAGAKVVDFGIAAAIGERLDFGPRGTLVGTPAYLAPERMAGGRVQPATDVYALGLLLYRMLTGALPWKAETTTQMIKAHCYAEPAPLPPIDGLPENIVGLVRRCLVKAPGERPTARAVAAELAEAAGVRVPLGEGAGRAGDAAGDGGDDDPTSNTAGQSGRPRSLGWAFADEATGDTRRRHRVRLAQGVAAAVGVVAAALLVSAWMGAPRNLPATAGAVAAAPGGGGAQPAGGHACQVRYQTRSDVRGSDAAGAFSVDVTIRNTGGRLLTDWILGFAFPGDQRMTQGWGARWTQAANAVAARDVAADARLPVGAATTIGFSGSYRAGNPLPTTFTVNGQECSYTVIGAAGEIRTGGPNTGGAAAGTGASASPPPASQAPPPAPPALAPPAPEPPGTSPPGDAPVGTPRPSPTTSPPPSTPDGRPSSRPPRQPAGTPGTRRSVKAALPN